MNHAVKNKPPRFLASRWQAVLVMFLLAFGINGLAKASLNDGLVAYWSFDDCTAKDNSGNANNGIIKGSLQCINGIANKSFLFDGASYITVPSSSSLNPVNQWTISLWVRVNKLDTATIIGKGATNWDGCGSDREYVIWLGQDAVTRNLLHTTSAGDTGCQHWFNSKSITVDKWFHVVYAIDRLNHISKIYIDGQLNTQQPDSYNSFNNSNLDLQIGRMDAQPNESYYFPPFKGMLDEIRLYNRALTPAEVTALYKQGQTTTPAFNELGELVDVEKTTIDYDAGKINIVLKKKPIPISIVETQSIYRVKVTIGDEIIADLYPTTKTMSVKFFPKSSKHNQQNKLINIEFARGISTDDNGDGIFTTKERSVGSLYGVTDPIRLSDTTDNHAILASRTLAQTKPHVGEECVTAHAVNSECNNFFAGDELPIFSKNVAVQSTLTHRIVDFDKVVGTSINPAWEKSLYGLKAALGVPGDNGRIPLLLIHGWQGGDGLRNPAKLGLWENSELHYSQHFLDYYLASTALQKKYHIYLYHYPTYKHVTYNAFILKQLLQEVGRDFPDTDLGRAMTTAINPEPLFGYKTDPQNALTIVAHSMGGMVARSLIEEYDGFGDSNIIDASMSQLNQLITLDTPHHGSTGSDPDLLLGAGAKLAGKDLTTQGAVDLNWDNFDNRLNPDKFTALNEKYRWPEELANSKAFDAAYANNLCSGACASTFTMNPWLLNLHSTFVKNYQAAASRKYVLYAAWMSNEQETKELANKFAAVVKFATGWQSLYKTFQDFFTASQVYNIDNITNGISYDGAEAIGIPDLPNGVAAPVTSALLSGVSDTNIDITLPFNPLSKSEKPAPYYSPTATATEANWWYSFDDSLLPKNAEGSQLHSILISKAAEGNPYNHPFGLPYRIFWDYDHEKMINGAYLGNVGAWDALIPTNTKTFPTVAIKATAFHNNSLRNDYIFAASSYRGKAFSINNDQTYNPLQSEPLYLVLERDLLLPKLAVTDTSIDFGTVTNDTPLTHDVSLTNQGIGDLQVNNIVITGRDESLFEVIPSSCPLLSTSQTCGFTVTFTPPAKPWVLLGGYFNVKTATLTIRSNDRDNPNLRITLNARLK